MKTASHLRRPNFSLSRSSVALSALTASLLLSACGGGQTTTPSDNASLAEAPKTTGLAKGTVTGFDPVNVDGVSYDNSASTVSSDAPDTLKTLPGLSSELKLGQQVELSYTGAEAKSRAGGLKIAPELVGVVSAVAPALVVNGQTVTVNTDAAQGPVTVFEGYTKASDIKLGDRVEIHGQATATGVQATRIELRPASEAWVRSAGSIAALSADGKSFQLGGLTVQLATGAQLIPSDAVLANGLRVTVWSKTALSGATLSADAVRVAQASTVRSPDRASEPSRASRPDRASEPDRASRPDHASEPGRASRPEHASGPRSASAPDRASEPNRASRPDRASEPGRASRPDRASEPSRASRPEHASEPGRASRPERASAPAAASAAKAGRGALPASGASAPEAASRPARGASGAAEVREARVAGLVAGLDAATGSFKIGTVSVTTTAAVFLGGTKADLANGKWVELRGTVDATTGVLAATKVAFRKVAPNDVQVRLAGAISDFVDASHFKVRGTPIVLDGSTVTTDCSAALAQGTLVKVTGVISGANVLAKSLQCVTLPDGMTLDGKASIVSVDTAAMTLTVNGKLFGKLALSYSADTVVKGEDGSAKTVADLTAGSRVLLKGTVSANTVKLTSITLDTDADRSPAQDALKDAKETSGTASKLVKSAAGALTSLTVSDLAYTVTATTHIHARGPALAEGSKVRVLFKDVVTDGVTTREALLIKVLR